MKHLEERQIDRAWIIGLGLAAIVLLTFQLGNSPLRDWDEGLVAQVAREIWRAPAGALTWLYPTMWGQPYLNKPPLVHGLIALAYQLGGVSEWTARLPGALLTASSVPWLYAIGREVFYSRSPAVFSALVYLTSLSVVRMGRLAMLDGAILGFLMAMMWCVLRSRRDYRFGLGVGLSLGLICLTKGVMLGLLLGAIALGFIAWDTPRLLRQPWLWGGLLLGLLPVAGWYGAQWFQYGQDFLGKNLVNQSFDRIWTDVEANRGAPWYYLLELLENGAPWIVFLPVSIRLAWQNRSLSWAKLSIVWSSVYLMAISLMATKLPWYILPIYPAIALMTGAQLAAFWKGGKQSGLQPFEPVPYARIWIGVFAVLAIAALAGGLYFGSWVSPAEPDLQLIFLTFALTLTATFILIVRQNPQFISVLIWGTYLSLMLFVASDHWNWELAEAYPVQPVATMIQQQVPAGQQVFTSYPLNRPSLNFYSDRPVIPAASQRLIQVWQRRKQPYLLLDPASLSTLPLESKQQLGTAGEWILITKAGGKS